MGITFNWFKDVKIDERELGMFEYNDPVEYIDGYGCNHSGIHVSQIQDVFKTYGNRQIPYIDEYYFRGTKEDLIRILIPKDEVIEICNKFLNDPDETDLNDVRDDIEWIKRLSEDGYYISYESL